MVHLQLSHDLLHRPSKSDLGNILRYNCRDLPTINSQASLLACIITWFKTGPVNAKRLTTKGEVAHIAGLRVFTGYHAVRVRPLAMPNSRIEFISSFSFFTIGWLRMLHSYHTRHFVNPIWRTKATDNAGYTTTMSTYDRPSIPKGALTLGASQGVGRSHSRCRGVLKHVLCVPTQCIDQAAFDVDPLVLWELFLHLPTNPCK